MVHNEFYLEYYDRCVDHNSVAPSHNKYHRLHHRGKERALVIFSIHWHIVVIWMNTENDQKSLLISALKKCGAVKFGDFTLASGKKSKYYVDIKKASTDPATLTVIAEQAASLIHEEKIDLVGGVALGGVPLATAVSLKSELPLLIVRKEEKGYGTGGRFIGDLKEGSRVILIEDVTTSGGSVKDAIAAIRGTGGFVGVVITVVDREEGAQQSLAALGVKLIPLVTASDLIQ
ncbi:MAG: Orotate phosphoribosyltransferase [Methanomethylovorans sp. PtaU1.Bin093]|nr:MAG: Orotate phosphoribosyltransferase [Methanomethylovorans sp. PtaU1.Bin093]